jgi:AcrR family transcriptional regulator
MPSDTRDRILSAAALLFQEHGYHGTGVASILDAAEVNSGSLYHFFDTKEALLEGVVEHHLRRLEPMILDPAEAAHHDPVERIFIALEHYRRTLLGSGLANGCAVGRIALEIGEDEPGVRALVERYFSVWTARVEGWLESAGARLPAGTDRAALAHVVLATTQGGIMLARSATSIEPFDAAVAQLRNHLQLLMHRPGEAPTEATPISTDREPTVSEERRSHETPGWRSW